MPQGKAGRGSASADRSAEPSAETEQLKRIANLLALLSVKDEPQVEQIAVLGSAGFSVAEIAELLGTTRNTVSVTLSQRKTKKRARRTKKKA